MLNRLICAIRGHRFGQDIREVDQFGNDWLVHDCERCGWTEVIKRPPPIDVIVIGTITTKVIGGSSGAFSVNLDTNRAVS